MEIRLCDITNNTTDIRDYFIVDNGKILINGARLYNVILDTDKATLHQQMEMFDSKDEMFKKAQAFDNYIVDMVKSIETYPHDYIKHSNFAKETHDFYMRSKEDFIETYKNEVSHGHELIESVEEYDKIIDELERVDDER